MFKFYLIFKKKKKKEKLNGSFLNNTEQQGNIAR